MFVSVTTPSPAHLHWIYVGLTLIGTLRDECRPSQQQPKLGMVHRLLSAIYDICSPGLDSLQIRSSRWSLYGVISEVIANIFTDCPVD